MTDEKNRKGPEVEVRGERAELLRQLAESGSLEYIGMILTPCTCGLMKLAMAVKLPGHDAYSIVGKHLPEDVDFERALRNPDAIKADVILNGESVSQDRAAQLFPDIAARYSIYATIRGVEAIGVIGEDEYSLVEQMRLEIKGSTDLRA